MNEARPSRSPLSRAFDLIAVSAVAVVVLMPKASIVAHPALVGERVELSHIAALEDAAFAQPDSVDAAVELAEAYLRREHPDWALSLLQRFVARGDHRVHQLRATAYAERLDALASLAEIERGLAACDAEGDARCPAYVRIRLGYLQTSMKALADAKIDPYTDPRAAKEAVTKVLHATKAPPIPKK
jgi:hypothetical protein